MTLHAGEGYARVDGGWVWYGVVGSGNATPLLCVHGGPGFSHDYLESLADLADERPVVFYDQLGCGNSERPDDDSLWILERFVAELGQVRDALGLERVHILGQSWGSMVLVDYALTRAPGIDSMVLASPCLSVSRWLRDVNLLRRALPPQIQEVLDRHEAVGTLASAEYQAAMTEYNRRHLCRIDPWPIELERSMAKAGRAVTSAMWGPSEFSMSRGNLRYYDRTPRLREIERPVLWTCGRFDQARPETVSHYQSLLPGSEFVLFERSSHTSHIEERAHYVQVVREFLRRVESA